MKTLTSRSRSALAGLLVSSISVVSVISSILFMALPVHAKERAPAPSVAAQNVGPTIQIRAKGIIATTVVDLVQLGTTVRALGKATHKDIIVTTSADGIQPWIAWLDNLRSGQADVRSGTVDMQIRAEHAFGCRAEFDQAYPRAIEFYTPHADAPVMVRITLAVGKMSMSCTSTGTALPLVSSNVPAPKSK